MAALTVMDNVLASALVCLVVLSIVCLMLCRLSAFLDHHHRFHGK